ncbi:SMC family ATPase [Paenibacillus lycopersici]|uniref:Nuclease SbcCD subunit C n=1 Tax=Paenibacillus lycopersici TaxID=2704462 RepID=A0A6C0FYE9_9BACL|nr:SMC family ATPase [Paenibacillus lycopersici]QHT60284.1 SMC family ATPase [Paenibacillus lycopersici]
MKPISLRLSGLQSYREAQEIDFERLTEAGVFGIFGPTGSGKSSILDAMTLALYGKVERASGGTQGIMNQAEKTLAVSFTFDLAGGGERKRFRVERQFKRGGDVSVSNTLSRFVEVTEAGDVVIADKLADVTRCVEAQIGLNMQDFTRAVVLPQGKFAEFLSLTGKDRRSMLQRLFRLERFGDGLALKLSQRMKAAEAALQEAAAEQLGLGDASADAVEAAAARYREAADAAAEAAALFAEADRLHAERAQVRERLAELRGKEALHAQLQAEAPRVAELERELQRLAAAERLLPVLAAARAAEAALRDAAARREQAERAHAARQAEASAAAAAWSAVTAEAMAGEPRLLLRLDQLEGARRLEGEAAGLAADIAAAAERAGEAAERQRSFGEQAAKAQEMLSRASAKQAELRDALKAVELTAADRERRGEMTKRLQHYNGLAAQTDAARAERAAAAAARGEAGSALEAAEHERESAAEALAAQAEQVLPVRGLLAGVSGKLDAAVAAIPSWAEIVRQGQRERQRMLLAAQLAAELKDGEPCPVCGSHEHQGRHGMPLAVDEAADAQLQAWEELGGRFRRLQLTLMPLQAKAEAAADRLLETLQAAGRGAAEEGSERETDRLMQASHLLEAAAGAETPSPPQTLPSSQTHPSSQTQSTSGMQSHTPQTLHSADAAAIMPAPEPSSSLQPSDALDSFNAAFAAMQELIASNGQQLAALEKTASAARTRFAETERLLAQCASACKTQEALAARAQERLDRCEQERGSAMAAWQAQFGAALQPNAAEETLQELGRREAAAEDLRKRLDVSVSYIEEKSREQQESSRLAQEARLEAVELTATLAGRQQRLDEKRKQLNEVTGGLPAAGLLREAEQELASLRERKELHAQRHEAAQQSLQQAAELRTVTAEAERAAAERERSTGGDWASALERSPFESAAEVAALEPLLTRKDEIEAGIARHRDEEQQVSAQIRLLRDQLGGRTLTEEEWERSADALRQLRTENERCIQSAAKAERDLESLRGKQERWNELESKRLGMERLTGRLKSLQTVFRGNAFVEYVAEEQLVQVCRAASERLGFLTKRRYALEVDSGGGFVIRDDAGGGVRRPVSTLSGGETFLASLALALALSSQIQLRGKYPLQFFFLDEGFGTLDPELLDTVITALEKLHHETLAVGVISHVPELRSRLPRRLIVTSSEPFGKGSSVALETM